MNRRIGIVTVLATLGIAPPWAPMAAEAGSKVVVPAGTTIMVRMIDSIDSTKTGPGDSGLVAGVANVVIAPGCHYSKCLGAARDHGFECTPRSDYVSALDLQFGQMTCARH